VRFDREHNLPIVSRGLRPRGHGWAGPGGLNRLDASGRTDAWRRAKLTAQCGAVKRARSPRPDGEVPPHAPGQAGRRLRGECRRPLSRLRQLLPPRGTALDLWPNEFMTEDGRHLICSTTERFRKDTGICVEGPCPGARPRCPGRRGGRGIAGRDMAELTPTRSMPRCRRPMRGSTAPLKARTSRPWTQCGAMPTTCAASIRGWGLLTGGRRCASPGTPSSRTAGSCGSRCRRGDPHRGRGGLGHRHGEHPLPAPGNISVTAVLVTNVYERTGTRWRMVLHHASHILTGEPDRESDPAPSSRRPFWRGHA